MAPIIAGWPHPQFPPIALRRRVSRIRYPRVEREIGVLTTELPIQPTRRKTAVPSELASDPRPDELEQEFARLWLARQNGFDVGRKRFVGQRPDCNRDWSAHNSEETIL